MKNQTRVAVNRDWREFIELLNSHEVDYLITGAWCVAFHAEPKTTGDIDFAVRCELKNASKLEDVMRAFGFITTPQLTKEDFLVPGMVIQLGYKPNRIDILTGCFPVSFDVAWAKRHEISVNGMSLKFLDRDSLIECKRAAGREKDLADIALLERTRPIENKSEIENKSGKEKDKEVPQDRKQPGASNEPELAPDPDDDLDYDP